ncbi:uncharacterized protein LOC116842886 isoform X2 [Odontomachus brunneus]|nr:uncharacterized protein LOC116842886 isoform X2 [Odontomachus brunneus]
MCTSLSDKECGSELVPSSTVKPIECTVNNMREWYNKKIKQHNVLDSIKWLFDVEEIQHQDTYQSPKMACSKMTLNVENQDVIIRTCQTAKTDNFDPCQIMEGKLDSHQLVKMDKCSLCLREACNSTTVMSPDILYIFLSFLGSLIYIALYLA